MVNCHCCSREIKDIPTDPFFSAYEMNGNPVYICERCWHQHFREFPLYETAADAKAVREAYRVGSSRSPTSREELG